MSEGTWHYVICREQSDVGEDYYSIRELHTDLHGEVSWTEDAIEPQGSSWSDLVTDLAYMMNAAGRQVLDLTHEPPTFVDAHRLPR